MERLYKNYKKLNKETKKAIVIGTVTATVLGGSYIGTAHILESLTQPKFVKTIQFEQAKTKVDIGKIIVENSKEISELNIFQQQVSRLHRYEIKGLGYKKTLDVKYTYNFKYHINLDNIDSTNVITEGDKVTIFISEPKVDVVQLPELTKVGEVQSDGLLKWLTTDQIKIDIADETKVLNNLLKDVNIEANSQENIELSKEYSDKAIQQFLLKLGLDYDVTVRYVR